MDRGMVIAAVTIVAGLGGTMAAVVSKSAGQDRPIAPAAWIAPRPEPAYDPASRPAGADDGAENENGAAQAAREAAQAADAAAQAAMVTWPANVSDPRSGNDGPFPPASSEYIAYYEEASGSCAPALGHSALELAKDVEGSSGMRIDGYEGFRDGILVKLKAGPRIAVWQKRIDCKDPPYDPQATPQQ